MRIEIFQSKGWFSGGKWRWRLRAANGQIIADSGEGYYNKGDMLEVLQSIRDNVTTAVVVELA